MLAQRRSASSSVSASARTRTTGSVPEGLTSSLPRPSSAAFSASAAQALPAGFWGVVPQAVPSLEQLQRLRRGGVESVRVPINWNVVQPTRGGVFSWDGTDTEVEEAADAGIRVFPFLSGVPAWAGVPSVFVPGSGRTVRAAAHLPVGGAARSGWVAFVQAAIGRYGPNGSFWAEHPTVPKLPVRTWQIWNEENFEYFVARPNPAEYGKLVGISYAAVKALDPGAQVILGGMFARPKGGRSKAKPKRNYFAADFLVHPTFYDPCSLVVLEALACGLPVVISDQVNIHRELSNAGAATVVTCSIDAVAAGIDAALADTGNRRRIAALGPAMVRDRYGWDAVVPRLIARYTEAIGVTSRQTQRS